MDVPRYLTQQESEIVRRYLQKVIFKEGRVTATVIAFGTKGYQSGLIADLLSYHSTAVPFQPLLHYYRARRVPRSKPYLRERCQPLSEDNALLLSRLDDISEATASGL